MSKEGIQSFVVAEDFVVADLARTFTALNTVNGYIHAVAGRKWPTSEWDIYLPPDNPRMAFARVQRIGGPDDISTDHPVLDIALLGRDRDFVRNLAEDIRTRYTRYPRLIEHEGRRVVFGKAGTVTAPQEVEWVDETLTHVFSSYQFHLRR